MGPKLPYFGAFRLEFEKTIAMFKIDTLKFTKMLKVMLNKKNPKFGTKIALLVCFWTGIKQTIVIFEINTFEFAKLELLIKKVNFGIELETHIKLCMTEVRVCFVKYALLKIVYAPSILELKVFIINDK